MSTHRRPPASDAEDADRAAKRLRTSEARAESSEPSSATSAAAPVSTSTASASAVSAASASALSASTDSPPTAVPITQEFHHTDADADADADGEAEALSRKAGTAFAASPPPDRHIPDEVQRQMREDIHRMPVEAWLEKYDAIRQRGELAEFRQFEQEMDLKLQAVQAEAGLEPDAVALLRKEMHGRFQDMLIDRYGKRQKRADLNTLDDAVELIRKAKHIMVLTGAGISVSTGIPDFRSKNGIYARLDEFELEDPQQMFDIHYFRIRPETFYSFAHEIYPSNFQPSPSHRFIHLLERQGQLLRNYTQNIDTLEQKAGIQNVVQCHGSFATARCIVCGYTQPGSALEKDIFAKTVPLCPKCPEEADGVIKPDIVFFGEKLPDAFDHAFREDREQVDLLIVMGSSLKVSPVADVKDKIPHHVPQILINREALPHMRGFDIQLLGESDVICAELCRRLGWDLGVSPQQCTTAPPPPDAAVAAADAAPIRFLPPHRYLFPGAVPPQGDDTIAGLQFGSDEDSDEDDASFGSEDEKLGDHAAHADGDSDASSENDGSDLEDNGNDESSLDAAKKADEDDPADGDAADDGDEGDGDEDDEDEGDLAGDAATAAQLHAELLGQALMDMARGNAGSESDSGDEDSEDDAGRDADGGKQRRPKLSGADVLKAALSLAQELADSRAAARGEGDNDVSAGAAGSDGGAATDNDDDEEEEADFTDSEVSDAEDSEGSDNDENDDHGEDDDEDAEDAKQGDADGQGATA